MTYFEKVKKESEERIKKLEKLSERIKKRIDEKTKAYMDMFDNDSDNPDLIDLDAKIVNLLEYGHVVETDLSLAIIAERRK